MSESRAVKQTVKNVIRTLKIVYVLFTDSSSLNLFLTGLNLHTTHPRDKILCVWMKAIFETYIEKHG